LINRRKKELQTRRFKNVKNGLEFNYNNTLDNYNNHYNEQLKVIREEKSNAYLDNLIKEQRNNSSMEEIVGKKLEKRKKIKLFSKFFTGGFFSIVLTGLGFLIKHTVSKSPDNIFIKSFFKITEYGLMDKLVFSKFGFLILIFYYLKYGTNSFIRNLPDPIGLFFKHIIYKKTILPVFNIFGSIGGRV
jgi:hypothetical protein